MTIIPNRKPRIQREERIEELPVVLEEEITENLLKRTMRIIPSLVHSNVNYSKKFHDENEFEAFELEEERISARGLSLWFPHYIRPFKHPFPKHSKKWWTRHVGPCLSSKGR